MESAPAGYVDPLAEWNTTRKRNQWGQVKPSRRPQDEWIATDAPETLEVDLPIFGLGDHDGIATFVHERAAVRPVAD